MSALRVISRLGQLALLPLLSACVSGGTLQSVETNCASRFPTYADAWSCARNQRAGSYDEYRARYLTTGDTLLNQVNRGQVSDAAARASLSGGFAGGGFGGGGGFPGGGGFGGGGGGGGRR